MGKSKNRNKSVENNGVAPPILNAPKISKKQRRRQQALRNQGPNQNEVYGSENYHFQYHHPLQDHDPQRRPLQNQPHQGPPRQNQTRLQNPRQAHHQYPYRNQAHRQQQPSAPNQWNRNRQNKKFNNENGQIRRTNRFVRKRAPPSLSPPPEKRRALSPLKGDNGEILTQ